MYSGLSLVRESCVWNASMIDQNERIASSCFANAKSLLSQTSSMVDEF